jgi:putative ABC transport system permease protein
VFDLSLPGATYDTTTKEDAFLDAFHARLAAIPGVVAVGSGGSLPLSGGASASLAIEGRDNPTSLPEIGYSPASDGYFAALGIPLLRGRLFGPQDRDDAPGVVVITDAVAQRWWPGTDPVGARVRIGPDPSHPWATIIGVVGDVRHDGAAGDLRPTVYVSQRQDHWGYARFALRVTGDPEAIIPQVRAALRAIDPALPLGTTSTMEEIVDASLATRKLPMQMIGAFAALAMLLSALGIYGVTAYAVSARTREIGTRLALGATPRGILAMILRQAASSAVIGSVLGIALAVAGGRLLRGLLFGVAPADGTTIAAACVALVALMLLAAAIPARRATKLDPVSALRAD